jgi:uncharacterized delta-60 repeat protein
VTSKVRATAWSYVLLVCGTVLLAVLLASALAHAAKPGDLDRSFSRNGKVTTNFGHYNAARDAAIDRHGRIVAVGLPEQRVFGLARYRRNGELDRTFSGNGKVTGGGSGDPSAVAIDSRGRIVVAGSEETTSSFDDGYFSLARYKPNGTVDDSFGGATVLEGPASLNAMAIDSQGRIVVAGELGNSALPNWWDFVLARYRPNGSLDPSFGGDGMVTTDFRGRGDAAHEVAIDSQGRIVAAGYAQRRTRHRGGPDFALARYTPNGSLDPSFDGDGRVTTHLGRSAIANSVTIDSQARIVGAGIANWRGRESKFGLARYRSDGELDAKFGSDGLVTTRFGRERGDGAGSVAIDSHGRIVAVGGTQAPRSDSDDFALARYWPSGNLDRSFSRNGKVTTTFGGDDEAASVVLASRDRIVAVGRGGRKSDFALARYIGYRRR